MRGFTLQADGALLLFMARGAVRAWRDGRLTTLIESIPDEVNTRFNDVIADPAGARARVGLLARQMRRDGKVYHDFYGDGQGEFTEHCDDPLWFILAVTEYLKETGDLEFLGAKEPFLDGGEGTILEHLLAVVRFAGANPGPHGLPKFGRGDWNDTLDYIGGKDGGESVWGAMFTVAMLNRLLELLGSLGTGETSRTSSR